MHSVSSESGQGGGSDTNPSSASHVHNRPGRRVRRSRGSTQNSGDHATTSDSGHSAGPAGTGRGQGESGTSTDKASYLRVTRLIQVVFTAIAAGTLISASANGFSAQTGSYFCLYGKYETCNGILTMNITLLIAAIIQLAFELFRTTKSTLLVFFEVSTTVVALASFVVQLALLQHSGSSALDATSKTASVFTFFSFLLGVAISVMMSQKPSTSTPQPLATWVTKRVFDIPEIALFGLMMLASAISLTIVGSFGVDGGSVTNGTCLFGMESDADAACTVLRVTGIVTLCLLPVLMVEARVRRRLASGKHNNVTNLPLAVDVLRLSTLLFLMAMQLVSSLLSLTNWLAVLDSDIAATLSGNQRYGGGSVIAFHMSNTMVSVAVLFKWLKDLNSYVPEASEDEVEHLQQDDSGFSVPNALYILLVLSGVGMAMFSAVSLATLTSANYDGAESLENLNSSCVYAENESECNFVIATAALSLVYHVLVILTNCGWCCRLCTERQCPKILSIGVEYAMPGVVFIMWLSSASLQAHNKTHSDRVYYNEADLNAAIVFSFFATALGLVKFVTTCMTELESRDPQVQFETRSGNWRLIGLILLVISSLLSVILSAQHAYWPDTAGELSGQCIFGSSAPACTTLVASYSISLAVTCGLLIVSVLKIRHPVHPLAATILSVPCMLLAWLLVFLVNIEWHWSISNLNVAPSSAMQYNSGYTLAANSVFSALLWSLLVFMWIRFALDSFNFSTLFRVRPIKVTAGDVPADSESDDDAALGGDCRNEPVVTAAGG
eukprot:scpid48482/ scgid2563/ 